MPNLKTELKQTLKRFKINTKWHKEQAEAHQKKHKSYLELIKFLEEMSGKKA